MIGNFPLRKIPWHLTSWILSASLFLAAKSDAQVSISPLVIEVEAQRGQAQGVINVGNATNEPFRARVYAEPFTYSRDQGFQTLGKGEKTDLTPYLQFSPTELNVPAGIERRIRFIIRLPPSMPSGEYRAVVFTENLKEASNQNGTRIGLATRIGVTIYVRNGNLSPSLSVENASWNTEKKHIQMLVNNTGNASARPQVNWQLRQQETVIKTGNLNSTGIVAHSQRHFLLEYPDITPGEYQLSGELIWFEGKSQRQKSFNVNLIVPTTATAAK